MYYLQTKASFDAAHFLWKYEGKCRNIHGHRWNVVAKIKSQELEQEGQTRGMVVDFGNLKNDLKVFCDYFDHSLIYETGSLKAETVDCTSEGRVSFGRSLFSSDSRKFRILFLQKIDGFRVWSSLCGSI